MRQPSPGHGPATTECPPASAAPLRPVPLLMPADMAPLSSTHLMPSAGSDTGPLRSAGADAGRLRPAGTDTSPLRPAGTDTAPPRPVPMGKMAWMQYKEDYCCAPTLAQATPPKSGLSFQSSFLH